MKELVLESDNSVSVEIQNEFLVLEIDGWVESEVFGILLGWGVISMEY